ncbi:MAG: MBG domain-containing protein [Negativicutes bacterium]|jgi:filamentous hemagglutinin family protein
MLYRVVATSLLAIAVAVAMHCSLYAAPAGGQIAAGVGNIAQNGTVTTINQVSDKLAVNWQSFNIAANEKVQFIQPSASAIALNRILGNNPTEVYGQLSANGKVFLVNPNGILFGPGAQINVGGLVASSQKITDADFMAGRYIFSGENGQVVNQGNIQAAENSYVALLAPEVRNEGVITARLGSVALGSGQQATLDFTGDGKINLAIDGAVAKAIVENRCLIQADGGMVIMAAKAKDALIDTVVNNSGIIQARSMASENGTITISGGDSGFVEVSGTLDVSGINAGETGGTVKVLGDKVGVLTGAKVDAAGDQCGGLVEVSGKSGLAFDGQVNLAALNGTSGKLLMSSKNVLVSDSEANGSTHNVSAAAVEAAIATGNVTLQAANDITIDAVISSQDSTNELKLEAGRDVVVSDSIYLPRGTVSLQGNTDPAGGINRDHGNGNIIFDEFAGITADNVLMLLRSTTRYNYWKAGEIRISGGQFRTNTFNVYTDGSFAQYLSQIPNETYAISGLGSNYCNDVLIQAHGDISVGLIKSLSTLIVSKRNFFILYNRDELNANSQSYPGIMTGDTGKFWVYATNPYNSDLKHMAAQSDVKKLYGRPAVLLNYSGPPNLFAPRPNISGKNGYFCFTGIPKLTLVADNVSKTYGDPNPPLTYHVTGLVAGDSLQDVLIGSPVLILREDGKNCGSYPVFIDYGTAIAYNGYSLGLLRGSLTVKKAPLTVKANDEARLYGQTNPIFTASFSGFKLGEDQSVLNGKLEYNTQAQPGSPIGDYLVTPFGLTSDNYDIYYTSGVLKVLANPMPHKDLYKSVIASLKAVNIRQPGTKETDRYDRVTIVTDEMSDEYLEERLLVD